MGRVYHLMTDPPGMTYCGEGRGFGDYGNYPGELVLYPDRWCPACLRRHLEIHKGKRLPQVVRPCVQQEGPFCDGLD